jgi:predicted  nucleic acid-binding Zn-ribbon protein
MSPTNAPGRARLPVALAILAALLFAAPAVRGATFLRGDVNGDGRVALGDVIGTLGFLFLHSHQSECLDAADSNDTGNVDIADCLFTLTHLFAGGSAPPSPGVERCGLDPTADELGPCSSAYCQTGASGGPGALVLPTDNTAEVAAMFAKGLVRDAVTKVLNSDADSIDLHLKGSASVMAIVPGTAINVSLSIDPSIQRTADGGFELSLSLEAAAGPGLQLYEGVEAGVMAVAKSKVLCRFGSLEESIEAIEALVAARLLLPLSEGAEAVLGEMESLAADLDQAIETLELSRRTEQAIRAGVAAAQASIADLQRQIDSLSKPIRDAQARIKSLEEAVGAACGAVKLPGCSALRDSLAAARRAMGALDSQKAALVRLLDGARKELGSLTQALQPAVDAVRAAEAFVGEIEEAMAFLREQAERASEVLEIIGKSRARIEATAVAYEYRKSSAGKVEAFLSPFPGVKLENAGIGGELSGDAAVTARVEIGLGGSPSSVTVTVSREAKLAVAGGFVAGAKASAALQLSAVLGFELGGERFVEAGGSLQVALDAQVVAVAGLVYTLQYGVGTKLSLSLDLAEVVDVASGLWSLARDGQGTELIETLVGLEATYTRQDRRIAAAVVAAAAGELGNSAGIEASATWNDQGPAAAQTLAIGQSVKALFASDAVQDLVDRLQEAALAPRA